MPFTFHRALTCDCGNKIADQNRSGFCRSCFYKLTNARLKTGGFTTRRRPPAPSAPFSFDELGNLVRLHGE
jgi:hypothetical protein